MNEYQRIAAIIRYIDDCHTAQPDLASLARQAGLSPYHFHRLFASWAGITPKDFIRCLTAAHAKQLLRAGETVFDTALETGLSGPGRLHDLCVAIEAATPGELKSGGAGWTITAGFADTPFGLGLVAENPRGICHMAFIEPGSEESALASLATEWPKATLVRDDSATAKIVGRIFHPPSAQHQQPLRAYVRGTPFQVRVWRALLQVPSGTLVSYGQLASAIGQATAARAVGTAIGQNALAYLIPCHRVIRETGIVGNYRWGHERKRAIMAWESSPRSAPDTEHALSPTNWNETIMTASSNEVTLFHAPNTRATGVRILLEELGADYTLKVLNLKAGEQRNADYLAINPMGKVPAILYNGALVTEQVAIFLYLADLYPQAGLTPAIDDPRRGPYLRWMAFYGSCFEPALMDRAQNNAPAPRSTSPYGDFDTMFKTLTDQLAKGPFLLGNKFTAVDILWGTALTWTTRFQLIPALPVIQNYVDRFNARPAVIRVREMDAELAAAQV